MAISYFLAEDEIFKDLLLEYEMMELIDSGYAGSDSLYVLDNERNGNPIFRDIEDVTKNGLGSIHLPSVFDQP